jgi:hypothetical protein
MAWTEQCKIDANRQVEHLKETKGYSTRKACVELSGESGIPIKTLQEWTTYPDGRPERKVSEKSDTVKYCPPLPKAMIDDWRGFIDFCEKEERINLTEMRQRIALLENDALVQDLTKRAWNDLMELRGVVILLSCYRLQNIGKCPGCDAGRKLKKLWDENDCDAYYEDDNGQRTLLPID